MGATNSKEIKGGYRILKICENSPASCCDLEIFFDYIIQIDGVLLADASKKTYDIFIKKIKENENQSVSLIVYNCRMNKKKEITIHPQKWAGNGLLGININFEPFNALNEGSRVIDILKNSPAGNSDLIEQKDFIIGCEESILRNREDVLSFVNAEYINHMKSGNEENMKMILYVYNTDTEKIRKVFIQPSKSWGGDGLLGCNIANGILHKIPLCQNKDNTNYPNETNSNSEDINFIQEQNKNKEKTTEEKNEENIQENNEEKQREDLSTAIKILNESSVFGNKEVKLNDEYNKEGLKDKCRFNTNIESIKEVQDNNDIVVENEEEKKDACSSNEDYNGEDGAKQTGKRKNDKQNNFIHLKSGYSIIITSEEEIEEEKKEIAKQKEIVPNEKKHGENDGENKNVYSNFMDQIETYSKELDEICEGMNKNNEILNNIGLDTKIKNVSCQNEHTEKNIPPDEVHLEINQTERDCNSKCELSNTENAKENFDEKREEKNEEQVEVKMEGDMDVVVKKKAVIEIEPEVETNAKATLPENVKLLENVQTEDAEDVNSHNSSINKNDVEESKKKITESEHNSKKETNKLDKNNLPIDDDDDDIHHDPDTVKNNNFKNNANVDLLINDLPKAGIIYPTTNL